MPSDWQAYIRVTTHAMRCSPPRLRTVPSTFGFRSLDRDRHLKTQPPNSFVPSAR